VRTVIWRRLHRIREKLESFMFLGSSTVSTPSKPSIRSAVFARWNRVTDRLTDRHTHATGTTTASRVWRGLKILTLQHVWEGMEGNCFFLASELATGYLRFCWNAERAVIYGLSGLAFETTGWRDFSTSPKWQYKLISVQSLGVTRVCLTTSISVLKINNRSSLRYASHCFWTNAMIYFASVMAVLLFPITVK